MKRFVLAGILALTMFPFAGCASEEPADDVETATEEGALLDRTNPDTLAGSMEIDTPGTATGTAPDYEP